MRKYTLVVACCVTLLGELHVGEKITIKKTYSHNGFGQQDDISAALSGAHVMDGVEGLWERGSGLRWTQLCDH